MWPEEADVARMLNGAKLKTHGRPAFRQKEAAGRTSSSGT